MGIFSEFAPLYWDAGIPVMPLKKRQKAPILNDWTVYGNHFPSEGVRELWLETYPDNNIGLPFGEASGLVAIDIDTDDETLIEAIESCLPASPWKRVGKKGYAAIFKGAGIKNFKIRSDEGMICELLGKGNQLVLPPSIHPDTGRAYEANVGLYEVMDKVQKLPLDIEQQLRDVLGIKAGVKLANEGRSAPMVVVPQGERDIQLVRHAGYLGRVVLGIDRHQKFTLAEAIDHMHTWVVQFTKGAAGDDIDPEKGIAKLLEFLLKDVEKGKTMPDGWDRGLTADQLSHPAIARMSEKNEVQRWTPSKAREWLNENCDLRPDDNDWAVEKVTELLTMLAADDHFSLVQLESLQRDIIRWIGKGTLSKPAIKNIFKDARNGITEDLEVADDHEAIARQVIELIERDGELRHANGSFWQWNGSCFEQLTDADITRKVMDVKGNALCRRLTDYKGVTGVIKILATRELMDEKVLGVNFANGFLDIDGELHEHAPRFGQTFTMPFNYAPERAGECHKWLAFLERSWGDDPDYADKVAALQEAFATTMFGNAPDYQRAILLYGKAGSGKSTALDVLKAMMPPAAVSVIPPTTWNRRFALSGMVGKTLNVCGELSESIPIESSAFKGVVCGEEQPTEFKGQDQFDFQPRAAHWFGANYLPTSRDGTQGFLRRWLILHFSRVVQAEEKVVRYHEQLVAEEREAIAAWAIQGMARLEKNRDYTLPASHHRLVKSVQRANNLVAGWLENNGKIFGTKNKADVADAQVLHERFSWYLRDVQGIPRVAVPNIERFKQMMEELGFDEEMYMDPLGDPRFRIVGVKNTAPTVIN